MSSSQPLPQKFFHSYVHLSTYRILLQLSLREGGTKNPQKFPYKILSLDPVPTFPLKDCVGILLPSVTKLVNLSLAEGVFPQKFKKAVVTPLIKKASRPSKDLKNY